MHQYFIFYGGDANGTVTFLHFEGALADTNIGGISFFTMDMQMEP